jgi:hypothetical protein
MKVPANIERYRAMGCARCGGDSKNIYRIPKLDRRGVVILCDGCYRAVMRNAKNDEDRARRSLPYVRRDYHKRPHMGR